MTIFKKAMSGAGERIIKGAVLGLIIILPGISGGTILLALGLYEDLMKDLSRLNLAPWLPLALGTGGGILLSGWVFAWLFEIYTTVILAFLLGCILASVKSVLGKNCHLSIKRGISLIIGLVIGLVLASVSDFAMSDASSPGIFLLILGGALSSVAMILPGIPGNSVLIIMGIYDNLMLALARLDWMILSIFAAGSVLGILGLSNALDKIYSRHRDILNWFFVGLIVGSSKMIMPASLDNPLTFVLVAILGFVLVWKWES